MLSVAQAEADRTSEKVSAVVQWRKAQGAYIGRPPLGFTLERDTLKIDPNTEAAVRAFFQTYLSTAGDRRAAVESAATAGVSITPKRANHMLTCHTYTHGYLSEEQFTETCRLNHLHRRKPHASGHIYLFSGLVRCAVCGLHCGGRLTKSGDGAAIPVYTCKGRYSAIHNCSGVNKSEYVIERICLEQLEGAIEERQAELERPSEAERDIDAEIRRIQGKLARLRELYIDGDISREDYSERKQKLEAVMPVSLRRKKSIPLPKLPDDWKQIYNQLDAKHRQAFWAGIIDRIEIKREYGAGVKIFLR
jgi:site-specific DNA recombinase